MIVVWFFASVLTLALFGWGIFVTLEGVNLREYRWYRRLRGGTWHYVKHLNGETRWIRYQSGERRGHFEWTVIKEDYTKR